MKNSHIILTILGVMVSVMAYGQGAPPATPIDGGLSLLLAAGGAYGLKKLLNRKK